MRNSNIRYCLVMILLVYGILLSACAPSTSGNVYQRDQVQRSMSVYYGTLLRVTEVVIEGQPGPAGTVAGGAVGGALGSAVGRGSGRTIAIAAGAVAGAMAGSAIEKNATSAAGLELEVELDNGEILIVVQGNDALYRVGDRVRVIKDSGGNTRVRQ